MFSGCRSKREKKRKKGGQGMQGGRAEGRINKKERKAGRKFANWANASAPWFSRLPPWVSCACHFNETIYKN